MDAPKTENSVKIDFDDGSRIINQKIEGQSISVDDVSWQEFYGIQKVLTFILNGGFKRVALQFPDVMLCDVSKVMRELENGLGGAEGTLIFALGDTSYGSCCVDEVNAEHLGAEALVHFGPACLSPTSRLPICYVFGCNPFDVEECAESLNGSIQGLPPETKFILLYEVGYHHRIHTLASMLVLPEQGSLVVGALPKGLQHNSKELQEESPASSAPDYGLDQTSMILAGLEVPKLEEDELESTVILYLGEEGRTLTNLLMRCNKSRCFTFDPNRNIKQGPKVREETGTCNKALMRRFYLVQKARDSAIFGLVIGTLGVAGYLETIKKMQKLITSKGRKAYTFAVGKINVAKLANFAEVETFVLVACPENSLLESREFHAPIITPLELEIALGAREWGFYSMNFNDLHTENATGPENIESTINGQDKDAPYFSLVSGTYKAQPGFQHLEATEDEKVEGREIISYQSPAGNFLQNREFKGLEQATGKSEVHAAKEGQVGIASNYRGV